jgi:hypothetical protein
MIKTNNERIEEIYLIYRDYIKHEDDLINQRITWLIGIQSFLIASFGFSYQKKFDVISGALLKNPLCKDITLKALKSTLENYNLFLESFCVIGFMTSLVALISVHAANISLRNLRTQWTEGTTGQKRDRFRDKLKSFFLYPPLKWFWDKLKSFFADETPGQDWKYINTEASNSQIDMPKLDHLPGIIGGGKNVAHWLGSIPIYGLPLFFLVFWAVIGLALSPLWNCKEVTSCF